jgi:hypothetical protein
MFTKRIASELKKRQSDTAEVKSIIQGEHFNENFKKCVYINNPSLIKTEVHHQVLCPDSQISHDYKRLYGKQ